AKMLKYLLLKPLEPKDLPALQGLTTREICKVWAAASRFIRKQLSQKMEIEVGTFALVPACATVQRDTVLPLEIPMFQPNRFMRSFCKLKCTKTQIPEETPHTELDFEEIAVDLHFQQEIVKKCVQETLVFFAEALQENKEVEFSFK
ncbi:CCD81 protein, partial [Rhinopomastus cyanomelas]|nr:CCD81 protein [Rhinopomastus cyanomelas]